MSQGEQLLNALSIEEIATYTSNPESERHIVIDDSRYISVPAELKRIAVQNDHNIETVTFDCPRYWDKNDLSKMDVSIIYVCSDGIPEAYPVKHVYLDNVDPSIMHFDWIIDDSISEKPGSISFLVCASTTKMHLFDDQIQLDMNPTRYYYANMLDAEDIDVSTDHSCKITFNNEVEFPIQYDETVGYYVGGLDSEQGSFCVKILDKPVVNTMTLPLYDDLVINSEELTAISQELIVTTALSNDDNTTGRFSNVPIENSSVLKGGYCYVTVNSVTKSFPVQYDSSFGYYIGDNKKNNETNVGFYINILDNPVDGNNVEFKITNYSSFCNKFNSSVAENITSKQFGATLRKEGIIDTTYNKDVIIDSRMLEEGATCRITMGGVTKSFPVQYDSRLGYFIGDNIHDPDELYGFYINVLKKSTYGYNVQTRVLSASLMLDVFGLTKSDGYSYAVDVELCKEVDTNVEFKIYSPDALRETFGISAGDTNPYIISVNIETYRELRHWHTEINSEMYVSKGLDCKATIPERHPSVLETIMARLDSSSVSISNLISNISVIENNISNINANFNNFYTKDNTYNKQEIEERTRYDMNQISEAMKSDFYTKNEIDSRPVSDYDQNDPNANDYIKNRPFYDIEPSKTQVLFMNCKCEDLEDGVVDNVVLDSDLLEGATCRVTVNGVAKSIPVKYDSRFGYYIGANKLVASDTTNGFYINILDNPVDENNVEMKIISSSFLINFGLINVGLTNQTLTAVLYSDIKKIPRRFLPDAIVPNYKQNDSTASDYIANRPFYEIEPYKSQSLFTIYKVADWGSNGASHNIAITDLDMLKNGSCNVTIGSVTKSLPIEYDSRFGYYIGDNMLVTNNTTYGFYINILDNPVDGNNVEIRLTDPYDLNSIFGVPVASVGSATLTATIYKDANVVTLSKKFLPMSQIKEDMKSDFYTKAEIDALFAQLTQQQEV